MLGSFSKKLATAILAVFLVAGGVYGASVITYTLNSSPADTDQLLLIDDPSGSWAINRVTVANLLKSITDLIGGNTSGDILTTDDTQTISGKTFSQAATMDMIDTGSGNEGRPIDLLVPNLPALGHFRMDFGKEADSNNSGSLRFNYAAEDSTSNFASLGVNGLVSLMVNGAENVGIQTTTPTAPLDVNGEIQGTSLDINGAADISGATTLTQATISGTLAVNGLVGTGLAVAGTQTIAYSLDVGTTLDIGSGTTTRVAPTGTFVDNAATNYNPNISDTLLTITTVVTISTFESVGATGSGADNIWTALNYVPDDADYVWVRIHGYASGGSASTTESQLVYARSGAGSEAAATDNLIHSVYFYADGSGNGTGGNVSTHPIPLDSSGIFDIEWTSSATSNTIVLTLIGWGFNP